MTGEKVCNVSGQNICLPRWPRFFNLMAKSETLIKAQNIIFEAVICVKPYLIAERWFQVNWNDFFCCSVRRPAMNALVWELHS